MYVKLHQNARTTPAVRREIQASSLSASQLAARYGIGKATALK
ncbi:MAG TPA: IS481 family transposase, partial [Chlorobaculum parvum]|nr:IS481 family transposase [Chlorobaculum parvum]